MCCLLSCRRTGAWAQMVDWARAGSRAARCAPSTLVREQLGPGAETRAGRREAERVLLESGDMSDPTARRQQRNLQHSGPGVQRPLGGAPGGCGRPDAIRIEDAGAIAAAIAWNTCAALRPTGAMPIPGINAVTLMEMQRDARPTPGRAIAGGDRGGGGAAHGQRPAGLLGLRHPTGAGGAGVRSSSARKPHWRMRWPDGASLGRGNHGQKFTAHH